MAGLCESGNEPPGSLKTTSLKEEKFRVRYCICQERRQQAILPCEFQKLRMPEAGARLENLRPVRVGRRMERVKWTVRIRRKNDAETNQEEEEEKELVWSLAENTLPTEGCTGRNGITPTAELQREKGILRVPIKTGKARMGLIAEWINQANPPLVTSRRIPRDDTNEFHSSFTNLIKRRIAMAKEHLLRNSGKKTKKETSEVLSMEGGILWGRNMDITTK
ncbi:hypothetical protein ANN_24572 [Periplaneta americana]|uniref:Uncharacterized protein n=1 Tax=Periplaneta americana TaxID=6978 RepID=A0ABQ8S3K9_PERAM|nr:hypothetical protein ANN_24572 [Periplaneta americana]